MRKPIIAMLIKLAQSVSDRDGDPEEAITAEIQNMGAAKQSDLIAELASFNPPIIVTNETIAQVATDYIHEWCMVDPDYYTQFRARLPRCA